MKDGRSPRQLGIALAEAMVQKRPERALPQIFVASSEFGTFCRGRHFSDMQRIECEKAYHGRYEELKNG